MNAPDDQPHPLHRLERLGDPAEGGAGERHPPGHQLLLLAGGLDPGPPGDVHRLGDADALRRPQRLDDRRLPGGHPDDRRVGSERSRQDIDSLLNKALGPQGYYGVFTANMHTDSASSSGSDAIVASAQSHGVPVVSAQQMLTVARRPQPTPPSTGSPGAGTRSASPSLHASAPNGLRGMVPTTSSVGALTTVKRDGVPIHDNRPDDQGDRVRVLRRDAPAATRRPTRSTTPLLRSPTSRPRPRATARPTSPGTRTRHLTRVSTTAPARARSTHIRAVRV